MTAHKRALKPLGKLQICTPYLVGSSGEISHRIDQFLPIRVFRESQANLISITFHEVTDLLTVY